MISLAVISGVFEIEDISPYAIFGMSEVDEKKEINGQSSICTDHPEL